MRTSRLLLTVLATLVLAALAAASPVSAGSPRLLKIGDFSQPVDLASPPGDPKRLFVVEQGGTVRVVASGSRLKTPFLDIRSRVTAGGEQGLLSLAFAPDYSTSRRFYVYYTDRQGDIVVEEYKRSKDSKNRADSKSRRKVIEIGHRMAFLNISFTPSLSCSSM